MKKIGLILGLGLFALTHQSFTTTPMNQSTVKEVVDGDEITFKIKNDTGGGVRLQFKGSGGDSGTMSMNSNITTEFTKAAGCKVYDYESGKFLFEVTDDMKETTVKLSSYM